MQKLHKTGKKEAAAKCQWYAGQNLAEGIYDVVNVPEVRFLYVHRPKWSGRCGSRN